MSSDGQVYLKIGEVARVVGISPSAIRAWEALGLTRPQRTRSQYRLYTHDDVRLLKKARYLRKVRGLNAAAIVQMLKREGSID
ncbi:MAG: MerR family transcriptional regulator, partial [Terriglobales bacterium]